MEKDFNWLDQYGTQLAEVNQHHERFSRIIEDLSQADDKTIIRRLREEVYFEWNDTYNTGVKDIDSQHKHFLLDYQVFSSCPNLLSFLGTIPCIPFQ